MPAYAGTVALVAVAAVSLLLQRGDAIESPWLVGVLAISAIAAQRASIKVSANIQQSLSLLPILCAAVLFGPLAAALVGAVSLMPDFHRPYLRWQVYTCGRVLNGACAGVVATAILRDGGILRIALAASATALCAEAFDVLFAALTFRVRGNSAKTLLGSLLPLSLTAAPIFGATIALLALAYEFVSPWTMPLFLFPAIGIQRLFLMYQDQRTYAASLRDANEQLRTASLSFAGALIAALDARDSYTAGHSAAVAVYARDIASALELSSTDVDTVYKAGLVHDIGKIAMPGGILEKTGPLTSDERTAMEQHPVSGEVMLRRINEFDEIALIVRHHHERIDGRGYPDGLAGASIPYLSRVIAVADSYNAMTSDRPYRGALSPSVAYRRLLENAGSQFEPEIVEAFAAVLKRQGADYRAGRFESEDAPQAVAVPRTGLTAVEMVDSSAA